FCIFLRKFGMGRHGDLSPTSDTAGYNPFRKHGDSLFSVFVPFSYCRIRGPKIFAPQSMTTRQSFSCIFANPFKYGLSAFCEAASVLFSSKLADVGRIAVLLTRPPQEKTVTVRRIIPAQKPHL